VIMGVLMGFVIGYVVGAKTGAGDSERLREAGQGITESPELRGLIATAGSFVENALSRGSLLGNLLDRSAAGR